MKNLAASVKARLLNIVRSEGRDFNRVLLLYMQERFVARLARSEYRERFVLKGGVYLYLRYGSRARSTVDLDLLGRALPPDMDLIAGIMRDVAETSSRMACVSTPTRFAPLAYVRKLSTKASARS